MSRILEHLQQMSGEKKTKNGHLILAYLVACGFDDWEVLPYFLASPSPKSRDAALAMSGSIGNTIKYFDGLVQKIIGENTKYEGELIHDVPVAEGSNIDVNSKESILEALMQKYQQTQDPKQAADILMKIADLQKMKQDEVKEEKKHTMVYLPATCHDCPCLHEIQKEHPEIKPLSTC